MQLVQLVDMSEQQKGNANRVFTKSANMRHDSRSMANYLRAHTNISSEALRVLCKLHEREDVNTWFTAAYSSYTFSFELQLPLEHKLYNLLCEKAPLRHKDFESLGLSVNTELAIIEIMQLGAELKTAFASDHLTLTIEYNG